VEIVLAAAVIVAAVCALALFFPPSIGREISFTAPYQPKPEWYFLWFYQAARYFPGEWAFWGLVFLPALVFIGLLIVPGLDRNSGRGRILALGVCCLIASLVFGLTVLSLIR
jgi:quinol-cytochrome oxidoreductase complex cytochrome b subunit